MIRVALKRVLLLAAGAFLLTGCYLTQAAWGQLDLLSRAEPIGGLIESGRTPPKLRQALRQVPFVKRFGAHHGLRVSDNYQDYAQLNRLSAVWVLTACDPLRFESKTWTFPIVGSVPYLGFFDLRDARRYADELAQEGLDVAIRSTTAYSTLGWFRDPVLSTMLTRGASVMGDLVETVLHESVHATVFVSGQSYFNESLARFSAERLAPEFLRENLGPESFELVGYTRQLARRRQDADAVLATYQALSEVYASDRSPLEMLARKFQFLADLEDRLDTERELNNAFLQGFKAYQVGEELFAGLLDHCQRDWRAFFSQLGQLTPASFSAAQQENLAPVLEPLLLAPCSVVEPENPG